MLYHTCHHSFVEGSDDADEPFWTTELGQDGPQTPTADGIKSLCEIHKQYVEVLVLLAALLLYLAYREDHVYCSPVMPEASLALGDYIVQQVLSDAVQDDTGHDLPCYAQERDATVVVA